MLSASLNKTFPSFLHTTRDFFFLPEIATDTWSEWPGSQLSDDCHVTTSPFSRLERAARPKRPHTSLGLNRFRRNPACVQDLDLSPHEIEDRTGSREASYVFGLNEVGRGGIINDNDNDNDDE